jgi:hypothetical protein
MKLHWQLVIVVAAAMSLMGCSAIDLCENTFIRQAGSPDGKLKAVVFSRGCGATTSESMEVSILEANASPPNGAGNIFGADVSNVYVKWLSSSQLQVTAPATSKVYTKEQKYGSITIIYK